ncbi:YfcE family phosphodiesterase [Bacteroidetes bacterium SCGC AAA795-G10]|nr:YfcE family phosphodiesterase [Bacteroidetes bacterium SCGC AAA795-G10]
MLKNILLLSDTHGYIDEKIISHTNYVDEVWHAGDIGDTRVIDSIKLLKPIKAVYGNIDSNEIRMMTEKNLIFDSEGIRVVMTHIAGYPGRYNRDAIELIQKYNPNLFICGHSHMLKVIQDKKYNHLHFNPGAAGIYGFHKKRTMLKFSLENGTIKNLFVIELK